MLNKTGFEQQQEKSDHMWGIFNKINSLLLIGSHGGPEALQEKLNLEFYMQQNYSKMKEIKMHRANLSVADLPTLQEILKTPSCRNERTLDNKLNPHKY